MLVWEALVCSLSRRFQSHAMSVVQPKSAAVTTANNQRAFRTLILPSLETSTRSVLKTAATKLPGRYDIAMTVATRMMLESCWLLLAICVRRRLSAEEVAERLSSDRMCVRMSSLWRWSRIFRSCQVYYISPCKVIRRTK